MEAVDFRASSRSSKTSKYHVMAATALDCPKEVCISRKMESCLQFKTNTAESMNLLCILKYT